MGSASRCASVFTSCKRFFSRMLVATALAWVVAPAPLTIAATNSGNSPVFTSSGPFAIGESPSNGNLVGDVDANDGDGGGADVGITYTIVGGNTGNAFAIDDTSGAITVADGPKIDFESNKSFALMVQADDGDSQESATVTVDVIDMPPTRPYDTDNAVDSVAEDAPNGTTVGIDVKSIDPPAGGTITYILVDDANGRFAIDGVGQVTVADSSQLDFESATNHTIEIEARDADGTASTALSVAIAVTDVPENPINATPVAVDDSYSLNEDTSASLDVLSNDSDADAGQTLSLEGVSVPNSGGSASIDGSTLIYQPAANFSGVERFSYTISDGNGGTDQAQVAVTVNEVNDAPQIVTTPATVVQPGQMYGYTLSAEDIDGDSLGISASGLPGWLSLMDQGDGTARLSGTPSSEQSGEYDLALTARDGRGGSDTQRFNLRVAPPQNRAPEFVTEPEERAFVGYEYQYAIEANDPDGEVPPVLMAQQTPIWLSFVPAGDGTAQLFGTPLAGDLGESDSIVIRASDELGAVTRQTFDLDVLRGDATTLSVEVSVAPPAAVAGEGELDYTAVVRNDGRVAASGELQWQFTGTDLTLETAQLPADCQLGPQADSSVVTCPVTDLASGSELGFDLAVASAEAGDVFARAEVTTTVEDSYPEDNIARRAGHFSPVPTGSSSPVGQTSETLAVGDVNGDGRSDVVLATRAGERTQVWYNTGEGELEAGPLVDDWYDPRDLALADVDDDGDQDLIVIREEGGRVYRNSGNGQFQSGTALYEGDYNAVATADLNGNGLMDLALAGGEGQPDAVYRNLGDGGYVQAATLGNGDSRALVAADMDGDGYNDIAIARHDGPAVIYRNISLADGNADSLNFESFATLGNGRFTAIVAGDLNGDGAPDLVLGRDDEEIDEQDAPGKPGGLSILARKSQPAPGDSVPSNPVYANSGTGEFEWVADLGRSPTTALDLADVDGDGDLDLLFTNATGVHQVYLTEPSFAFRVDPVSSVAGNMTRGQLIDLDGSGELDRVFGGDEQSGAAIFLSSASEALRPVDLSVSLQVPPVKIEVGDYRPVTARLTNSGANTARDLSFTIELDSGLYWRNVALTGGQCQGEGRTLNCQIAELAGGASSELSFEVASDHTGHYAIEVQAASANDEQTPDDNRARGTVHAEFYGVDNGGGGALDWWLLLLMGAGLCYRVSGRHRRSVVN